MRSGHTPSRSLQMSSLRPCCASGSVSDCVKGSGVPAFAGMTDGWWRSLAPAPCRHHMMSWRRTGDTASGASGAASILFRYRPVRLTGRKAGSTVPGRPGAAPSPRRGGSPRGRWRRPRSFLPAGRGRGGAGSPRTQGQAMRDAGEASASPALGAASRSRIIAAIWISARRGLAEIGLRVRSGPACGSWKRSNSAGR